jgi:hypothetical protein
VTADLSRLAKVKDGERTWGLKVFRGSDIEDLVGRLRSVVGEGVLVNRTARPTVIGVSLLRGCDVEATIAVLSLFEELVGVVPYPKIPASAVYGWGGYGFAQHLIKDKPAWQEWALQWIRKNEIVDRYTVGANCYDVGDGIERLIFVVNHADLCWLLRSRRYWGVRVENDHGRFMHSQWVPFKDLDRWVMAGNVFMSEVLPDARAEMLALFEAADVSRPAAIIEFCVRSGASLGKMIMTGETDAITKVSHLFASGEAGVLGDIPDGLPGLRVERDGDWVRLQFGEEADGVRGLNEQIYLARAKQAKGS